MQSSTTLHWSERYPTLQYVAPFVCFLLFLGVSSKRLLSVYWGAPIWVLVLAAVCYICWPRDLSLRPRYWGASILIGLAAFVLWIAPDVLIPGYRSSFWFSNSFLGQLHSSIQPDELRSPWVLAWRTARATLIVPIVEELFWRGWLMRWLVNSDFRSVRLGAYSHLAFWGTAILFASEHGPYWDVGLLTGIVYNLWMIRTRSIADCVLMHAVTNAALCAFVISTAQWQYWQ